MNENPSVPLRADASIEGESRTVPLARLAGDEGDAVRNAVVSRVLDADRSATRTPVSAFSSAI